MTAEARHPRPDLSAVLFEAMRLLDEQSRALQHADFTRLLRTTSSFQRLAERLGTIQSAAQMSVHTAEIAALRRRLASHRRILEGALAATVVTSHPHRRTSTPAPGRSLLLDHHT